MTSSILSIDGGGIKGIISAQILIALENHLKIYSKDEKACLSEYFDLIAGTSTGSIITALLLCPDQGGKAKYSAKDTLDLYVSHANELFEKRKFYPIHTCFGLFGPRYTNQVFGELLTKYVGELKISQLLKSCLIASYDMKSDRSVFFDTSSSVKDKKRDILVRDAVLASCAAPTYFPPICTKSNENCSNCLIDGGVVANNPALCALIESMKLSKKSTLQETIIVSIGNVKGEKSYSCERAKKWGLVGFSVPILKILMNSGEDIVDYQLQKLYENMGISQQYVRIDAYVKENQKVPRMDDTREKSIQALLQMGEEIVQKNEFKIRRVAKLLVERKSV